MPSLPSTHLTSLLGSSDTKRLIAATALVVAWTLGAPAEAAAEPPSDIGAVDVYREAIPTSTGGVVPDPKRERLAALAPGVESRLRAAGADGERLVRVARSSLFGAPMGNRSARSGPGEDPPDDVSRDAAGPTVIASPIRTPRGIALAALLVFGTATAVVVRVHRGRASVLDEAHGSRHIVS
jgi:hypothetical protein